jgi:dihydroflavonol-4-reductase
MKVAVTGATGHIGGMIVRELLDRHHDVKVLVRGMETKSLDGLTIEKIKGDLTDDDALRQLMASCDALIHSAAVISIDGGMDGLVYKTNVEGTRKVMEAAKASGIKRVIHISSIHAYEQKPLHATMDETRSLAGADTFAYDRSKREGQEIALSYASAGMEVLVVNPTSVIGPYDFRPSKLGHAIMRMHSGKLPFVFDGGFDFCDVRDVALASVNGLTMGRNGEAYLLGGKWYSLSDLASVLAEVSGKKIKPMVLPTLFGWIGLPFIKALSRVTRSEPLYTNEALVAVTDGNRCISHEKASRELNYTPRPLAETLRDTIEWFGKNGYLG